MATKTQYGRVALLSQAKTSWVGTTVLLKGEIGIETDTGLFKIGDGVSTWAELDYANAGFVLPIASETTLGGIKSQTAGTLGGVVVDGSTGLATVSEVAEAQSLSTARTIALSGDVTGSASFDGSADISITATVGDDSHDHTLSHVTDLAQAISFVDGTDPTAGIALANGSTAATQTDEDNSTKVATTAYVDTRVNNAIATAAVMHFKGVVDSTHPLPSSGMKAGDTYVVAEAGTYAGQVCEVGDMVIYVNSTQGWCVIQTNINGAVTGPTSAVDEHIPAFNGATGKIIKDSGLTYSDVTNVIDSIKINNTALTPDSNKGVAVTFSGAGIAEISGSGSAITITVDDVATTSADGLMSSADKTKLDGIEAGAEVNVIESVDSQDDAITVTTTGTAVDIAIADATASAHGLMTAAEKTKLAGIAAGAEVNVQADWSEADSSSDAYIQNKPQSLKNPNALTFGSQTYDGSVAKEITAGDLGAQVLVSGATANNVAKLDANGQAQDSGVALADLIDVSEDITLFQCTLSSTIPS